ncbi:MAG: DUF2254 domain-containing protein [Simkaniaceae bacterium]|nr:DUF2254 domain-containing protein [Candidatus Sacchlamyda saccharinae]
MARIKQIWIDIKSSFWFIPALINITLIFLAIAVVELDLFLATYDAPSFLDLMFIEQESVRTFLATVAGSMVTIAAMVFSITILVLALTAGQYSSRLLRNFMQKKHNQIVLGIFVGIFVFCLVLIINLQPNNNDIKALSGFITSLIGIGFLIYFIHKVSTSIQATEILRSTYDEVSNTVNLLYPDYLEEEKAPLKLIEGTYPIHSSEVGFLQAIDIKKLVELGKEHNIKIEVHPKIGSFITIRENICSIDKDLTTPSFIKEVLSAFVIGRYRAESEDIAYGIQQLSDLALKGLSNGMNDLTTSLTAVSYLTSLFIQLGNRDFGASTFYKENQSILYCPMQDFFLFADCGFRAIYQSAKNIPILQEKLNEALCKIQENIHLPNRRKILDQYISHVGDPN